MDFICNCCFFFLCSLHWHWLLISVPRIGNIFGKCEFNSNILENDFILQWEHIEPILIPNEKKTFQLFKSPKIIFELDQSLFFPLFVWSSKNQSKFLYVYVLFMPKPMLNMRPPTQYNRKIKYVNKNERSKKAINKSKKIHLNESVLSEFWMGE